MNIWFWILGGLYVFSLVMATVGARRNTHSANDFMMAGSNLGFLVGCLTVAATLFSTFTLLGMPDFFRTHGVGAWIFLAVSDAAIAFVIIWFGACIRRRARDTDFKGVAGLMSDCYESKWAGLLYLIGIFIFLVPYVAIQIRGIGVFLNATFPDALPIWGWAVVIVSVMLVYSELGGLKAIIFADAIQGVILLSVTLIIAYGCVSHFGGVADMFEEVRLNNEALLSVPGPEGLFTTQFLVASFLVLIMIPLTQPQMTIRLVIMRDIQSMNRMAILLGLFAIVLILATVPIGMYGAALYGTASTSDFLANALVFDQAPIIAAAVAIGLIAAAISTADSQLFALGNELRSMLAGTEQQDMVRTRVAIMGFAGVALIVAIFSGNQFVLLARVGFAGTALLAPFILAGLLASRPPGIEIPIVTGLALLLFLGSVAGMVPDNVGFLRLDLALLIGLSLFTVISVGYQSYRTRKTFVFTEP